MQADLLIRPDTFPGTAAGSFYFGPEAVGFEHLGFELRRVSAGQRWSATTGENELGLVILGGRCAVSSPEGNWSNLGNRADVFSGMPTSVYLPRQTEFVVSGETDCELACCFCRADVRYPARVIQPDDVEIEIRGGGNATRQINHVMKPNFPAHRLLIVEVYTPGGNWSSYPPHKHDVHQPPSEVDLEEIYYYKVDRPEGYAIQRVYTKDRRLDATLTVRDGELVLIPEGYHPVVAAHGYNVYYLNALAGSARSMAASDDPDYAWVRQSWKDRDPRVPVVRR